MYRKLNERTESTKDKENIIKDTIAISHTEGNPRNSFVWPLLFLLLIAWISEFNL